MLFRENESEVHENEPNENENDRACSVSSLDTGNKAEIELCDIKIYE